MLLDVRSGERGLTETHGLTLSSVPHSVLPSTRLHRLSLDLATTTLADLEQLFAYEGISGISLTDSIPTTLVKWLTYVLVLHPVGM